MSVAPASGGAPAPVVALMRGMAGVSPAGACPTRTGPKPRRRSTAATSSSQRWKRSSRSLEQAFWISSSTAGGMSGRAAAARGMGASAWSFMIS